MMFWNKDIPIKTDTLPLTLKQFKEKFQRNYINYAALVDVAFVDTDEMNEEYEKMSDADIKEIVKIAKEYAAHA
jgi:hypothetical protein